ncbi:hypothetical protein ACJX0J_028344, partial [Zea mays]
MHILSKKIILNITFLEEIQIKWAFLCAHFVDAFMPFWLLHYIWIYKSNLSHKDETIKTQQSSPYSITCFTGPPHRLFFKAAGKVALFEANIPKVKIHSAIEDINICFCLLDFVCFPYFFKTNCCLALFWPISYTLHNYLKNTFVLKNMGKHTKGTSAIDPYNILLIIIYLYLYWAESSHIDSSGPGHIMSPTQSLILFMTAQF